MLTRLAIVAVLVAAVTPAAADDTDTGYIGSRKIKLEIDDCPPPPALDQAAILDIASEHYDRGTVLFLQGDYEGAIQESIGFLCLVPTGTDVLYNVGQSYERLLEFEKAIGYYERYVIASNGDTAAEIAERQNVASRIQVLENLPARVQVSTEPEGATLAFTDEYGVRKNAGEIKDEPFAVHAGVYTMSVELPGYETVEKTLEARIGQPYSFFIQLQPRKGRLVVTAEPGDARIFVDDKLEAIGRYVEEVPRGTYSVVVEAPGRVTETRRVEVVADKDTEIPVRLARTASSGRRQLLIGGAIAGGILGSLAFGVLDQDTVGRGGLGFLGGVGLGLFGGWIAIPSDIDVGSSSYIITSGIVGAVEAGFITSLFTIGTTDAENTIGAIGAGGMALGAAFGAATAGKFDLDAGDAALLSTGALWGGVTGGLFAVAFESRDKISQMLTLGGLNLGIITTALLGRQVEVSRRHVAIIDLAGLAGMGIAVSAQAAIDDARDIPEDQVDPARTAHFALAGMATGLAFGAFATRNMDGPKLGRMTPVVSPSSTGKGTTVGLAGTW